MEIPPANACAYPKKRKKLALEWIEGSMAKDHAIGETHAVNRLRKANMRRQTPPGSRNMGLDPTNHRVFIVSAKFGPPPAGGRGRAPVLPGSFALMVIERAPAAR